ncbi:hypothetical protein EB796_025141 [Bugula neritina]|uniref:Uncharacterized protein n=1 Tax=Bugula neritina TaxID=10212 RepID=A0A7J7ITK1_BUGNE|nr:hypothetical protein EB796_025141 [Bugula neritina]
MLVMDIIYIMVVCHRTALIEASSRGCNSIVEFLLNNNCDLNKADIDGVTALHAASQAGHVETVESLLNSGASPHVKDTDGSTPLTAVCSCVGDELTNHVQVAKLLLQNRM